jgi:hypothetical protein
MPPSMRVTTQHRVHAIRRAIACSRAPERKLPNVSIRLGDRALQFSFMLELKPWLEDEIQRRFWVGMDYEVAGHDPPVQVPRLLARITGKLVIVFTLLNTSTHHLRWYMILKRYRSTMRNGGLTCRLMKTRIQV